MTSEAAEFGEDGVEALAADELHDVVVDAVLFADAEDGDDVGVVEAGGRLGFECEAAEGGLAESGVGGEDLEGDAAAEGLLLGLVDDAHAAAADLAEDAVVAEALGAGGAGLAAVARAMVVARVWVCV